MSALFHLPKAVRIKSSGAPYAGALARFYETGTTTAKDVHTDAARTIPFSQPLEADAAGQFDPIFINALDNYKVVLTDASGAQIDSIDPAFSALFDRDDIAGLLYPQSTAELSAGITPTDYTYPPYHVDRYGTNTTPGTTDMLTAFQSAITAARTAGGGGNVYWGETTTYYVSDTLVLASDTLAGVNLIANTAEWFGSAAQCRITSTIAGPTVNVSGVLATYAAAPLIERGTITNTSANAAACVIRADYCSGLRTDHCTLLCDNYGVYSAAETISPRFDETIVTSATPGGTMVACYLLASRNALWIKGRAYSASYAFDLTGDDPLLLSVNAEFNQVFLRHQALTGALILNAHIENTQCLLTNATDVPIDTGGAWVDNGSAGIGITGTVKFLGGLVAISNANTNLITIKTQGGFNYTLELDSVAIVATNYKVGSSFTPGTGTALSSGTKIIVKNCSPLAAFVQKPPLDSGSGYFFQNSSSAQGDIDTSSLRIGGNELNQSYDEATYTPTWASSGTAVSLGNGTITGRYTRNGNRVDGFISLTMGSTTTFGTGTYSFSLPIAAGVDSPCPSARADDTGANRYFGHTVILGGVAVVFTGASPGVQWGQTVPFTFGNTDLIYVPFSYFTN